ncbi:MAG: PhoH family protein [Lentisphaeria bacterium]|nr:PhoH family protein [Lentisphaeria bacterium]
MSKAPKIKTFVLDTNVLLHSAASIGCFHDNDVVIPMAVVEELDKFKKNSDELGRNSRRVIRLLDRLREKAQHPGALTRGVSLQSELPGATGKLFVLSVSALSGKADEVDGVFENELNLNSPDNRILRVARSLHDSGKHVIFISKDINLRLKADALGLKVMDFETRRTDGDNERNYNGYRKINLTDAELDKLYHTRQIPPGNIPELLTNEFALFASETREKHSAIARKRADNTITLLEHREKVWNLSPRNKEQRMALDLLMDPDIPLITLVGGAGTGKTLLALAAALQQTLHDNRYEKILVSRPIIPLGNDIGFLPGSKESKLASWMQPIFDNLEFLLGGEDDKKGKSSSRLTADSLINAHKLDLEAITYIRGRSIPRQFIIVDEAQNLTPHEVKTIISRCGNDSKMVLTGDPAQIDNPYLDASGNGLSYTVDRLKGESIFGHITLTRSERSDLAALAARKL